MHPADRARALVLRHGWNATSYQVLNPGFEYWFSDDGDAVVAYVTRHGVRVVAGVPICASEYVGRAAAEFERDAASMGMHVAYFCVEERVLTGWIGSDRSSFVIGAQPVWHPAALAGTMRSHASLRAQLNRVANKGVRVTRRTESTPDLRRVLHEWLDRRGLPPLHFLVEPDTLSNLRDRRLFVAERDGSAVAFLVISPIAGRDGWLVEQIVRGRAAPNGTAEALLMAAVSWMISDDAAVVTLGLSPLSRHAPPSRDAPPRSIRTLFGWLRIHGRRFYNFEGLDSFKAKFQPESWEPVHMVVPSATGLARALIAIGAAFGGTSAALFIPRVLAHALRQELKRLGGH